MYVKGLEVYAHHGVFPEEKENGQRFVIDLTMEMDLSESGTTDALEDTVSYADICEEVEKAMSAASYNLIEKVATVICTTVLEKFPKVNAVTVKLKKPQAPVVSRIEYAAVELRRER